METNLKKRKTLTKRQKHDYAFYGGIVAFFAIQYLVFYVFVHFNSILLLFQRYEPAAAGNYTWADPVFANFKRFIDEFFLDSNKLLRQSLLRGPLTYFLSLALGLIPGFVGPYYIHKKMPGGRIFKILFFLPGLFGTAVLVIMYTNIAEVFIPSLVQTITGKQIIGLFANPKTIFITLLLFNIWLGAGAGNILYIGTMNTIPQSLSEAMQMDGANHLQELIYLAFPTIYPVFSIGLWMGIPAILTGTLPTYVFFGNSANPGVYTLGYYVTLRTLLGGDFDYPYISAINVLICLISLPLIFIVRSLLEKFGPSSN